jgi:hypothetical protein
MKSPVTITMLIVGGCLIIAPLAFGALHEHQVSAIFTARSDLRSLNFGDDYSALSPVSRFGCWLTGTALCAVAVAGAAADSRRSYRALPPAAEDRAGFIPAKGSPL